jgi:hypothetical protein
VASILGLLITFGGFAIAFWQIRRTKTASEAAQRAAEGAREQILLMNAIQGLGEAIRALEDISRLHRLFAWSVLSDHYTSLRRNLIAIRGRTPTLSETKRTEIQAPIQQLSIIERQEERAISGPNPPATDRMNEVISRQIDRLAALLVDLQNGVEGTSE